MEHITHNKELKKNGNPENCSMFYVPCSMKQGGFTIVELLVVVVIISVLTSIIISNFPQAKLQLSLSRVAYKFEQDARRAQGMSLSYPQYKDSSGISHQVAGYGVYVDMLNNKKYIIYADSLPGNQSYDNLDYVAETIDFSLTEPGIIIKQINNIVGSNASVNFAPPNPTTTITTALCQNNMTVVFALESDLTKTKTVSINTAGLIQVANIATVSGSICCTANSDCGTNGLTGSPFCNSIGVCQNYITYTCNNPGTVNSTCTNSTVASCQACVSGQTCSNGICVPTPTPTPTPSMSMEYITTGNAVVYVGSTITSGAVDCSQTIPSGYGFVKKECLYSGSVCLADICLWKKPITSFYQYTISHAGSSGPAVDCSISPVSGYTVKSKTCVQNLNGVCVSDVCLWEQTSTNSTDYTSSHAGSSGTAVDCSTQMIVPGYALNNRVCVLSGTNCVSDYCLWQKP